MIAVTFTKISCLVLMCAALAAARTRCRPFDHDCKTVDLLNPKNSYRIDEIAHYECVKGHHIFNESIYDTSVNLTCQDVRPNRGWDGVPPICVPITCSSPGDGKYTVPVPDNLTCYCDDKFTYACEGGYETEDDLTVTCNAWGQWEPEPPCCEPICCGPVPEGNNTVEADMTLYFGEYYKYYCEEGYYTDDEVVTVCQADGSYTIPAPNCTALYCDPLMNGTNTVPIPYGFMLDPLDTYTYECLPGYETENELCAICLPCGEVTPQYPPNCTAVNATCGTPLNGNNTVEVPEGLVLSYPQSYTYECEYGYETEDELCTVCLKDGFSSPPPDCVPAMCENPPDGTNTEPVPVDEIAYPGESYNYTCLPGFIPYFEDSDYFSIYCMTNGDWSIDASEAPACTKECTLGGIITVGVVPNTGCKEVYTIAFDNPPSVGECPDGEILDLEGSCSCEAIDPALCAVP